MSEEVIGLDEPYRIRRGDCVQIMAEMPDKCMDFAIFSPPFPAVFAYTSSESDLGNSEDMLGDGKLHFSFFFRQFARLLKPGRVVCVHCMDIQRKKRAGGVGLFDFHGFLVRLGERAGLIHDYTWAIRKNPQSQAIRTRTWSLKFQGLESDRAKSRGALPDYLIKFMAPGDNAVPVDSEGEVSRNDWIDWAEYCWTDIKDTATLNAAAARSEEDTRHICPLQLPLIERLVRLYTNPEEIVFSPFAGIGSEGVSAVKHGRRFVGCELKDEYYVQMEKNLNAAIRERDAAQRTMFDAIEATS